MHLQPLAKITHARKYLKAQLAASSFDAATVMAVYERWYGANDEKLAVLMRDSPVLTRGDSGIFGSVCFMVDGVNLSTKLTAPTPEARVRRSTFRRGPRAATRCQAMSRWRSPTCSLRSRL